MQRNNVEELWLAQPVRYKQTIYLAAINLLVYTARRPGLEGEERVKCVVCV